MTEETKRPKSWWNLLRDADDEPSSGRVMAFVALLAALAIVVGLMLSDSKACDQQAAEIAQWLVLGAFGGKGLQKMAEKK